MAGQFTDARPCTIDSTGLEASLHRWVNQGLISPDQARAIVRTETAAPPVMAAAAGALPASNRKTSGRVAEVVGYIGAMLAAGAGSVIIARYWGDLETWSQLLLVAASTGLIAAGAAWVSPNRQPPVVRLASVLWFMATGGLSTFLGILGHESLGWASENVILLTGLGTLAASAALLWWRPSVLMHAACFGAAATSLGGWLSHIHHLSAVGIGPAIWGLGICWALLAWGEVLPRGGVGLVLGIGTAFVGAQVLVFPEKNAGIWLGLCTAVIVLAAAIPLRSRIMLAVGVPGLLIFMMQAIGHYVHFHRRSDQAGLVITLGLLIVGIAVTASALASVRRNVT